MHTSIHWCLRTPRRWLTPPRGRGSWWTRDTALRCVHPCMVSTHFHILFLLREHQTVNIFNGTHGKYPQKFACLNLKVLKVYFTFFGQPDLSKVSNVRIFTLFLQINNCGLFFFFQFLLSVHFALDQSESGIMYLKVFAYIRSSLAGLQRDKTKNKPEKNLVSYKESSPESLHQEDFCFVSDTLLKCICDKSFSLNGKHF